MRIIPLDINGKENFPFTSTFEKISAVNLIFCRWDFVLEIRKWFKCNNWKFVDCLFASNFQDSVIDYVLSTHLISELVCTSGKPSTVCLISVKLVPPCWLQPYSFIFKQAVHLYSKIEICNISTFQVITWIFITLDPQALHNPDINQGDYRICFSWCLPEAASDRQVTSTQQNLNHAWVRVTQGS